MGAMDLLGVEPDIPVVRLLAGQMIVLAVVAAHQHTEAAGGAELPGSGRPLGLLFALPLLPQEPCVPQLVADLHEILLRLGVLDLLQHALQILQIPTGDLQLLSQVLFGGLGLGVLLVVFGGVLLGRQ